MNYQWIAVVGCVVGLIARALLPGTQTLGIVLTALLGVVGALLAAYAGRALGWVGDSRSTAWIASGVGAVVLLVVVGKLKGSSPG